MSALTTETCPDHTRCMSCDAEVCEPCQVGGGATRCPHGDPICRDCDPTDWCGDCYTEQREAAAARRDGYEPRTVPCPVCSGVGAIQHRSRNPELIEDCGRCRGNGEVAA